MSRPLLEEAQIHPGIRQKVASQRTEIVAEVQQAIASHPVVVVGMGINPHPKRALRALKSAGIEPKYLEYGSYLGEWRRRTALKMWSGWPTFPMVFVKGSLIGGADEVEALLGSGELKRLLAD